jgi:hypothetical protein
MAVAERKTHVPADEGVDLGRLDSLEGGERFSDPRLEGREILWGLCHIGGEDTASPYIPCKKCTFDGAAQQRRKA